jgi:hypothetical protein
MAFPLPVIARLDRATRSGTAMSYVITSSRVSLIETGCAFV